MFRRFANQLKLPRERLWGRDESAEIPSRMDSSRCA